jgi:hypothetical protein
LNNRLIDIAEVEEAVTLAVRQIAAVSVCRRFLKPPGSVRFVPANLDEQPAEAPSSTKIRQAISGCPDEYLEDKLKSWALSPSLLAAYIKEHRRSGQI